MYIAAVLSVSVKEACWDKYPKLVLWSSGNNTQFVQRALSSIPEMAKMLKLQDHNEILSKPNHVIGPQITGHNYLKVSLLWAYIAIKEFGVVCLSETYLDSSNLSDDDNFNLPS